MHLSFTFMDVSSIIKYNRIKKLAINLDPKDTLASVWKFIEKHEKELEDCVVTFVGEVAPPEEIVSYLTILGVPLIIPDYLRDIEWK